MALIDVKPLDRFEAANDEALAQLGISLSFGHDFDLFKRITEKARPDHIVGDPFRSDLHELGRGNAVWIVGRDAEGNVIHLQALRLMPTGISSLAEYFRRSYSDYMPSGIEIDYKRSRYRPGPGAKRIKGRIVYSGDTWLTPDNPSYRGTEVSGLLGRRAFLIALRVFDPDYVVGFMARPVINKGYGMRFGFMHAEPSAVRLQVKNQSELIEGAMVYMSHEDVEFVLGLPIAESEALAA